jgi:NADH-quinone oxidoreductase subunit G
VAIGGATPEAAVDAAPMGADVTAESETPPAAPARPPTVTFTPPASPTEALAVDAYGLRLVATRTLYDRGTTVQHSPSLAKLAGEARLHMNVYDLTRLGLEQGGTVSVTSARGRLTCEAVPDDGVPRGAAWLPVNHDGPDPALLIDSGASVTTIQVETAR